jgi:hypothetical protein
MVVLRGGILDTLKSRRTIMLREPIVKRLGSVFRGQVVLPPGVTTEQAVKVIASTPWARGWAEGIAKLAGYTPGTPEFEEQVRRLSEFVARRLLGVA